MLLWVSEMTSLTAAIARTLQRVQVGRKRRGFPSG
jgi:hypothetical protein